jgi:hypothetical protein
MAVPIGTPRIWARAVPATTTEMALVCRPSGASRLAMTIATPKNRPWQHAMTRRAPSSIQYEAETAQMQLPTTKIATSPSSSARRGRVAVTRARIGPMMATPSA